ncbi:MAG: hypothetical protein MUF64_08035 [Polyangiaceae bacterium]|jgi:hypothetical protein|nr:hypothetical protein [Polyangiaceae bacterium]
MKDRRIDVILCEGFDDRSFWKGWLLRLGCEELLKAKNKDALPVLATGDRTGGTFDYATPAARILRVVPCNQKKPTEEANIKLKRREVDSLGAILINLDLDDRKIEDTHDEIETLRQKYGGTAISPDAFSLDGGESKVFSAVWWLDDTSPPAGTPEQNSLERIVCWAIINAYPDRGSAVEAWLASRTNPPAEDKRHKASAWSFYAGWYNDHGTGDFYSHVWKDDKVRDFLEKALGKIGLK